MSLLKKTKAQFPEPNSCAVQLFLKLYDTSCILVIFLFLVSRSVSSANEATVAFGVVGRSFVKILYRVGERQEPCGTLVRVGLLLESMSS